MTEKGEETEEEKKKRRRHFLMTFHRGSSTREKMKGKNEGSDEKTRQMENLAIIAFTPKHNCCCFDEENIRAIIHKFTG